MSEERDVVVVGGGIAGLVAALRLQQSGLDVTLLEAERRLGGKIATVDLEGVRVELGPDAFLPRDAAPLDLCAELGLADELVQPALFGAYILVDGTLHEMPQGTLLGFPTSWRHVQSYSALSLAGKLRALRGLVFRPRLEGDDVSVGELARASFGEEVLAKLVDPILAGTRAGNVDEMSLAAAVPEMDRLARGEHTAPGSAVVTPGDAPAFFAPREGMSELVAALAGKLQDTELVTGAEVSDVRADGDGKVVVAGQRELRARALVLGIPSTAAARLVRGVDEDAWAGLRSIDHGSGVTLNLVFDRGGIDPPPRGSGVLVASSEARTLSACTWVSRKWPHVSRNGRQVVRCFAGRGNDDSAVVGDDGELTERLLADLGDVATVRSDPVARRVTRWDRALPRYRVGHLDLVKQVRGSLARAGIHIVGASYDGSGIPDCIRQAETAAVALAESLRR